ncbi:NAD-dependent epimerase/dehydratase family protein [Polaribacter ponticola]|uniref:NAD-dependent epimerase/dehydratase family protein n=1 Tax=Polaribacter ponticola TaxID=2978475 RepID=A0ABT5SB18_9FLAO|nr:NAD-dependent epimerase/dehydratase family protein [Polaribacter sp. MSW5]MDD7915313.1 NAD-dependent epimerase/dehydratase family protein [Polaribacter sp. MSW5]
MVKILVTGSSGQLGTVLTKELQKKYGINNVIASDLIIKPTFKGISEILDVTNIDALEKVVLQYKITQIYHLAAILSAKGEINPLRTWDINMKTLFNVLEVSRLHNIKKIFHPSSIAVFGDEIEKINTPQAPNLTPLTVYGMSKTAGENWVNYYHKKYGMDIRSIRYPGVIGYQSLPGGGTTDYAVEIYHKAVKEENFDCFLEASTMLPMIFMDDVISATIQLMEAPSENIKIRTSYNLAGMSFTPEQVYESIKKIYPDFKINYQPDFRQDIANSWPDSIDDSAAKRHWGWKPRYDLDEMTNVMIEKLKEYYHLEIKI